MIYVDQQVSHSTLGGCLAAEHVFCEPDGGIERFSQHTPIPDSHVSRFTICLCKVKVF
jgi:hypothetical protein